MSQTTTLPAIDLEFLNANTSIGMYFKKTKDNKARATVQVINQKDLIKLAQMPHHDFEIYRSGANISIMATRTS